MRYLKVNIRDQNRTLKSLPEPSQNLRKLLLQNKVNLYKGMNRFLNCRGKGLCGTCLVRVVDNPAGLTDKTPIEKKMLWASSPQARLACQAWICGDVAIDSRKTDLSDEKHIADEAKEARLLESSE